MPISSAPNASQLFFWFWPAKFVENADDLVFWTNGGPGMHNLLYGPGLSTDVQHALRMQLSQRHAAGERSLHVDAWHWTSHSKPVVLD